MLLKTGLNNILLLVELQACSPEQYVEQYFAARCCKVVHLNNMLNNIVNNQEQYGQQNIVQDCFHQHCCVPCLSDVQRQ
jgi:hypothetical protein